MRSRRQRTRIEHAGLLLAAAFLLWGSPALALHPLVAVLIGAVWSLTRQIELDLGLRRGVNAAASGDAFLIGMTTRW